MKKVITSIVLVLGFTLVGQVVEQAVADVPQVQVQAKARGVGGHIFHHTPDENANAAWTIYCKTSANTTITYLQWEGQWSMNKPNCSYVFAVYVPAPYAVWCRVWNSGTVFSLKFGSGYNNWPGSNWLDCKTRIA